MFQGVAATKEKKKNSEYRDSQSTAAYVVICRKRGRNGLLLTYIASLVVPEGGKNNVRFVVFCPVLHNALCYVDGFLQLYQPVMQH